MKIKALIMCGLGVAVAGCQEAVPDWQGWHDTHSLDADSHWVRSNTVLLPAPEEGATIYLVANTNTGMRPVPLRRGALSPEMAQMVPHLADLVPFTVDLGRDDIRELTKSALYVLEVKDGEIVDLSMVQTGWLLDDLYASDASAAADLGAVVGDESVSFALWAPTATHVSVELYDPDLALTETLPMVEDDATGIWRVSTGLEAKGAYYRYGVTVYHPASDRVETLSVTDPYSLSLSTDSVYSQVVDLDDPSTQPAKWADQKSPVLPYPEAQILYEVHIGDFSGTDESIVDPSQRGTYAAFSLPNTDGVEHLEALAEAGLNTIHLLPTYDLGSIPEAKGAALTQLSTVGEVCARIADAPICGAEPDSRRLVEVLHSYDPASSDAQALIEAIDEVDDYNWGYDPYHYTVPEGSYALNPEGEARLVEFRQMIQTLHGMGFRVVMDVVYNHTYQAGLSEKSVLDKIVPGYYHRRHPVTGAIEQSTCCENTATERAMMEKLMSDSLVVWARDYKIDGFRFDLMGHQPKAAMLRARDKVRAIDPDTYFYGEGWNFGEVANNARFVQASQLELGGTEIGTFTDRLRDAVRGGSSFVDGDDLRRGQGLGNGLVTQPNELQDSAEALAQYRLYTDQLRVGLAGNLADYPLTDRQGRQVTGKDIPYGDAPTGYANDPADTITYISKHDNQTLWDNHQYRVAVTATPEERARMQLVSLSYVLYGQGIPFLHMGSELLRSKSFLRDSFNYGHWFNEVDFRYLENNADAGLPPAAKDKANWALISRLRAQNEGRDQVGPVEIVGAMNAFVDMLSIRSGSPLFALPTAEDIVARVSFLNQGPEAQIGLVVMRIVDGDGKSDLDDLDPFLTEIIIVFNHGPDTQRFMSPYTAGMQLHPVLKAGLDPVTRKAQVSEGAFVVPGWTTAVFIRPQ